MGPASNVDYILVDYTDEDIEAVKKMFPSCRITEEDDRSIRLVNPTEGESKNAGSIELHLGESGKICIHYEDWSAYVSYKNINDRGELLTQFILLSAGEQLIDIDFYDIKLCIGDMGQFHTFRLKSDDNLAEAVFRQLDMPELSMLQTSQSAILQVTTNEPSLGEMNDLSIQIHDRWPEADIAPVLMFHEVPNNEVICSWYTCL